MNDWDEEAVIIGIRSITVTSDKQVTIELAGGETRQFMGAQGVVGVG